MNADASITANFQVITYDLTTASGSGGSVTTPGEGSNTYNSGTVVNLVATPDSGYTFVNWSGDVTNVADVNAASTTITMNADASITANFQVITHPVIVSSTVAANNTYIDVAFSEGVYGDLIGNIPVDTADFIFTFTQNGGNAIGVTISSVTNTSGSALIGGESTIQINLTITGIPSGVETIEIKPTTSAIYDVNGNVVADTETTGAKTLNDQLAPSIQTHNPTNDATDVAIDANLVLTFDDNMTTGTGNINIKLSSDDSTFETIDVTTSLVTVSGNQVTINPSGDFANETDYYVLIDDTTLDDDAGNNYNGISSNSTWNFTTLAYTPPAPSPVTPPAPSGGGGGTPPDVEATHSLNLDMMGETAIVMVKTDGTFLEPFGFVSPDDDNLTLLIDANTKVSVDGDLIPESVELALSEEELPVPEELLQVGPIYDLNAYVDDQAAKTVTFDPPAKLVIKYDPETLPENATSVFIAYYDREEKSWIQIPHPEGYVAEVGVAIGMASHFTPFTVMADVAPTPSAARFELRNLEISPQQTMVGETITISGQLLNFGGLSGEHIVTINIEGLLETLQVIRLAPGQSRDISYNITPTESGSYLVKIGDLEDTFTVEAIPVPEPVTPKPAVPEPAAPAPVVLEPVKPEPAVPTEAVNYGWLIAILTAATLLALVFVTFTVRKRWQRVSVYKGPAALAPDAIRVSNLKIRPLRIKPGESVTVIAEVINTESVTIKYSLVLKVKSAVEAIKEVSLSPGQSQKAVFVILRDTPGIYDIELEGLKGTFTVEAALLPLELEVPVPAVEISG